MSDLDDEPTIFLFQLGPSSGRLVREATRQLRLQFETCPDRDSLFDCCTPTRPGCLLIDLVSDSDRLTILDSLRRRRIWIPVIVLSEDPNVRVVVETMRAGAWDYLVQPSESDRIRQAIQEALDQNRQCRRREFRRLEIERRIATLTEGERHVLDLLVKGKTNREVATLVDRSVRGVEVRRSKMMEKMKADSWVDLLRMVLTISSSEAE